jgi:phage terminase large subunit
VLFNSYYVPAKDNEDRYLILYGGAGSGKSYFAAQKILHRLMTEDGHRILACRKVATTLRESVFKQLKIVIDSCGQGENYTINQTNRTFTYNPNGNEIICFGLDDVEKLKSITNITSIWIEEATELDEDDLDQLDLRLRGITPHYKQIMMTFNPVDENHWLRKRFVPDDPTKNPPKNLFIMQSTFENNVFIDEEYKDVLRSKAEQNPNYYQIYCLGIWGKDEVKSPFIFNFNKDEHVSADIKYNKEHSLRFSLDFNVEPFVCLVLQIYTDVFGEHIHFLEEITLKEGNIHLMIETLRRKYTDLQLSTAFFTGDAMQFKREITQIRNISAWQILQNDLKITDRRLAVPKCNPHINNSRMHCNEMFHFHPDVKFHPKMINTLHDLQYVEVDEKGQIIKTNRKNQNQRADYLDAFRYAVNSWVGWHGRTEF